MHDPLDAVPRVLRFLIFFAVALAPTSTVIAAGKLDESGAIRKIEQLGGTFERDAKSIGRPVTSVTIRDGRFGNEDVYLLRELKHLTTLELGSASVSDAGLRELRGFERLTTLVLSVPTITDAGLKELGELNHLTELYLFQTKTTDAGLREIGGLKHLTSLGLYSTQVTDAGLKELRGAQEPDGTFARRQPDYGRRLEGSQRLQATDDA